ncbi:HAD family hydrolase [Paraflavitalea speifideaquila]|uniref:HAD family hydrolase n=1 Tax=Paraflavitalea speifideaquila TaxID=3076558 RepID=UPI003312FC1E
MIFDKTGTLTKGSHQVQKIIPLNEQFSADDILQYAAALQQSSEHHIAHGIMQKLKEKNLELWKSTDFNYMQGVGVTGTVNGKTLWRQVPIILNRKTGKYQLFLWKLTRR